MEHEKTSSSEFLPNDTEVIFKTRGGIGLGIVVGGYRLAVTQEIRPTDEDLPASVIQAGVPFNDVLITGTNIESKYQQGDVYSLATHTLIAIKR